MPMVCPQCRDSFEQRLACPQCGVRLAYTAIRIPSGSGSLASRWAGTPAGRVVIGLIVARGFIRGCVNFARQGCSPWRRRRRSRFATHSRGSCCCKGCRRWASWSARLGRGGPAKRHRVRQRGRTGERSTFVVTAAQGFAVTDAGNPLWTAHFADRSRTTGRRPGLYHSAPLQVVALELPPTGSKSHVRVRRRSSFFVGRVAWIRVVVGTAVEFAARFGPTSSSTWC